ncbi:unnamed protein product [Prunus brigantina]
MAEKNNQASPSAAATNGQHPTIDEESATLPSQELKRKKRIKLAIYISAFVVVQIIVITAFALTVMRVKSPKLRLGAISVQTLNASSSTPSFDMTFTTQVRIKNTNFGRYKFDATNARFMYEDRAVGQVRIPKSKAGMRSTKKIDVTVSLNSKELPSRSRYNLGNELKTGVLSLRSEARLAGKVELMFVMKKKKSAKMGCTLEFNLSTKKIQYLHCYY